MTEYQIEDDYFDSTDCIYQSYPVGKTFIKGNTPESSKGEATC